MARLALSLLGSLQVRLDGQPVTDFKSDKVRALLAYLAVEADRPHRRELLAALLWPEMPDRPARNNLRDVLANLRTAIGDRDASPPFLLITRETLQFNTASHYCLDVVAFNSLVMADQTGESILRELEEGIALYRGDFLEGFSVYDSAPFEEWALFTRERLARQMSSALHRLSAIFERRREYERARSYAWRQVELEPWDEAAHQGLMRLLALSGQRGAALTQYETCRRLLAEELGVEPATETTMLYEQIRDGTLKVPVSRPPRADRVAEPPPFLDTDEPVMVERPVFVARERELTQLGGFLELALAGQGRVVFVTGEAGSGKTALFQEFARRAQDGHGDLIVAGGNCNARTGIGDPYLPLREILGLLCGDVQARWAAGAINSEHAARLWHTLPLTARALAEVGPDLVDTFVPGTALLERAQAYAPAGADWLTSLDDLVQRQALRRALRSISTGASGQDVAAAPFSPGPGQSDLFEQYTGVLQRLARQAPLLLMLDDLQWADTGAISLLFHIGRQLAGCRILIVGAYRPEEVALGRVAFPLLAGGAEGGWERHPLVPVVNELQREFGDVAVNLDQAERRAFVGALLDSEPNRLGLPFREMLYRQTRGHPLFTVELLRGMQERGDVAQDPDGRWREGPALDWETLPARVEAAIAERIGRLAEPLRATLRVASVEGHDFTAEVAARVLGTDEREMVQRLSSELDRKHRLVHAQAIQRLGTRRLSHYRFRHFLCQKYLYDSLDSVERAYLHEDVGNALERLYVDQSQETAAIAPQLARHFQEARMVEKAIHYLHQAGERAVQLSAYKEGITHLSKGLDLLRALPHSGGTDRRIERAQLELRLQLALAMAWVGAKGHPVLEVEQAYTRARDLCQQMGMKPQLCRVLGGLSILYYVRAEHQRARGLAEEALGLAQQVKDSLLAALGHWYLGVVLFSLGEYTSARAQLAQVISFYDPHQHHHPLVFLHGSDPGVSALAYDACCLWCLGYPEQATKRSHEALSLARELGHSFSLADVLCYAGCLLDAMGHDAEALKEHAEELIGISHDRVPSWLGTATCFRGEALVRLGQVAEGIARMRQGMAGLQSLGVRCHVSGTLCSLAEAHAIAGQPVEGLRTLEEALAMVVQTDERHWEAELYRLRGELLLMQGDAKGAEASLQEAIAIARRQRAKSWELRATTSLARLCRQQGEADRVRGALAEIYDWFTEGFDTPDLIEARMLLED